ncbi:MAG: ATP-dependent DNA ligase, partial [Rhodobacteraceae bacterium]|nr:ATP-dependent DNA ligase [Paracoccaceae bacterium]
QGEDLRPKPFTTRRALLEKACAKLPADAPVRLSPLLDFATWDNLAEHRNLARAAQAEGVMLKRADSAYGVGRKKGDWWKWKLDPLTIDAVMIYAQAGHGRRANLFTDFTFAVWSGNELVPFTKAYSGLTDAEFREITAWVRKHTLQRFGPVRQVTPEHVFEIAFEGIQASPRHKSGVALRFPRMLRWRRDKPLSEANTIEDLRDMLATYG